MWLRLAACVALLLVPCLQGRAQNLPAAALTLDDAFARVARVHPELRLFGVRHDILLAERAQASQRPQLRIDAALENVLGSGTTRGLRGAELTLSLASVFERGGKLDARRVLAQARIDGLAMQRETRRLDLLAETARRYVALLATDEQHDIAKRNVHQRQRAVAAARKRLQVGAAPESVLLTAQVALARAELDQARMQQHAQFARQHLAALWGEHSPQFTLARADPFALPEIEPLTTLEARLKQAPELRQFADVQRLREARLQLARSAQTPDVEWSLGMRRLQAEDDVALVAGLSLPLGSRARAQSSIRIAQSELEALAIEREAQDIALYSTLVEAHGRYCGARLEVTRLGRDVLPKLAEAEAAAERAYRGGAASYLEWSQRQTEQIEVLRQRLAAAIEAHRALIELQRLTGQSLLLTASNSKETTR